MGDATHANVPFLARIPGLGLAGGYNTGSPDIQWTDADWAMFPGIPHIIIDQAFGDTNVAEAHAIVFDVEAGAFAPAQAGGLIDANTTLRPTIYVNQSNMAETIISAQQSPNWKGDVWLAFPNWQPGQPLPPLPAGCRYVAIQNQLDVNGLYDLSLVLDPAWPAPADPPKEEDMMIIWANSGNAYLLSGGRLHKIIDVAFIQYYVAAGALVAGSQGNAVVSDAEEAALLADFPPGQPVVTVPPVVFPKQTLTGTIAPA